MTKITINIENLTLNLSGATANQRNSAPSDLVANLIKEAIDRIHGKLDAEEVTSKDKVGGVTAVHANDIVEFIKSGEGGRRSGQEIVDKFELPGFIAALMMESLLNTGTVTSTGDGEGEDTVTYFSVVEQDTEQHVNAPDAAAEPAAPTPGTDMTDTTVVAFLNSDARYTKRTAKAVAKHFGVAEHVAAEALERLVSVGLVGQTRRRRDRIALFQALVPSHAVVDTGATAEAVSTEAAPVQPANADSIVEFLNSHPTYKQRTFGAIAKKFSSTNQDELRGMLDGMTDDVLTTKTRRSDGATLYSAA